MKKTLKKVLALSLGTLFLIIGFQNCSGISPISVGNKSISPQQEGGEGALSVAEEDSNKPPDESEQPEDEGEGGGTPEPSDPSEPSNAKAKLVGYWKFDAPSGNVLDSSGNQIIGFLENGATRFQGTRKGNKALFDGVDDRITIPISGVGNAISFTSWIRPASNAGAIMRLGNSSQARFHFGLSADGTLYLRTGRSSQVGVWKTRNTISLSRWSHVAVTYNFSSRPVFYINGVSQVIDELATPSGDVEGNSGVLYLGNNHDFVNRAASGFNTAFEGRMDEVRIYDGVVSGQGIVQIFAGE